MEWILVKQKKYQSPVMRSQPKKEIEKIASHKGMTDFEKIERERRLQSREEIRERALAL